MNQICGLYQINSLADTKFLANFVASLVKKRDIIALSGDLGAGKTTFARFFINSFCNKNLPVLSPSFSLVQNYGVIWHFDLYRLCNINDVYELDIEEALDCGITIIEWPEIFMSSLPQSSTVIIEIQILNSSRLAKIKCAKNWHAGNKLEKLFRGK